MWDIKQKATNKFVDTDNRTVVTREEGCEDEDEESK